MFFDWIVDCDYQDDKVMEGRKYDQDKPRWELLPLKVVEEIVKVLTHSAKTKYEDDNWKKVVTENPKRYYSALMRHLADY